MTNQATQPISAEMRECIKNCSDCHDLCLETIIHCLQMGGSHAEVTHILLLLDCADICQASADFMLRGSSFHPQVCGVCAEICDRCAEDCERFVDDTQMQACAAVCRRCAESCRRMVTHEF